jgi:hypothetical protein
MQKAVLAALCLCLLSACGRYSPSPEERIHIVDSPADVRACRRLGAVSEIVPTSPGFQARVDAMLAATVALGGTDLFLARTSGRDWSYVRGIAYRCPFDRPTRVIAPIVRALG